MTYNHFKKRTDSEQWDIDRPRIHALKNKVMQVKPGYSIDNYRDTILEISHRRTDSSKELTAPERQTLMDHLSVLAGESNPSPAAERSRSYPGRPRNMNVPDRADLLGKIEACLSERKLPWSYAETMAKRIGKKDAIEFCGPKELLKLIAAFGYDAKRKGLRK